MPDFDVAPTPNPNSLKVTTDAGPFIEEGLASFDSPDEADGHPLGERLFAVAGVENVLIMPEFVTITKGAGTEWDLLMPKIKSVLANHFEGASSDD
ncbi:MAG: scaffolding protein [Bacteroidetes bacterium QS_1_65_9]|nr:MAG: scaffolding protein [Bacteroidetes bacterium QS_1_65_9]